jgi:hypothetical protein
METQDRTYAKEIALVLMERSRFVKDTFEQLFPTQSIG